MRPTRAVFWLLILGLFLAVWVSVDPSLLRWWQGFCLLILGLLVVDALGARGIATPEVTRRVDHALPLGVWSKVKLTISNAHGRAVSFQIHDFHPGDLKVEALPFAADLPAMSTLQHTYRILPEARGPLDFAPAQLLLRSPLGFWHMTRRAGLGEQIRVYPNFRAVASYTLMDMGQRLAQIGIHRRQRRGEGREFHQLREFIQGDPLRQIDWKSSSRMRKLISREYRDERDQQVVFLLDLGQSMRARDDALSHFDHALNAVLLMTNVALRHGDAVGLMTFSGQKRWLATRKGMGQMNLILNSIYDIQPGLQTSDYMGAARQVLGNLRKRSLLVLVTNLKDEDHGELAPALRLLRRKHLVLLASMRERVLHDVLEQPIESFGDALAVAATHAYLKNRRQVYETLKAKGVLCLDTVPDQLPVAMVNSYLDIKSRGLL